MFDSNYNANSNLPIYYQSNNTTHHHHPFDDHLFNNFPSHLLGDDELFLDTILPYNTPTPPPPPPSLVSTTVDETTDIGGDNNNNPLQCEKAVASKKGVKKKQQYRVGGGSSSKRKTGKKDRHSKIHTAHGPRDRRMRLSLQIARKFFDLQDMLGFDKASKTIEWLFNKSKAAIKDLSDKSCTSILPSSPSPLEEIIEGDENNNNYVGNNQDNLCEKIKEGNTINNNNNKGGMFKVNEKRKEARARARERTKEKLLIKNDNNNSNKDCSLEMEENPNSLDNVMRGNEVNLQQPLEDHMASVGIIEKFLATTAAASIDDSQGEGLARAFSMDLEQFGVNHQVQGYNYAFMDRTYNQGYID